MEKKEIVERLKKKGYDIALEGNIPVVKTADKAMTIDKFRTIIRAEGYDCSFGLRYVAKENLTELEENEDGQMSFF